MRERWDFDPTWKGGIQSDAWKIYGRGIVNQTKAISQEGTLIKELYYDVRLTDIRAC